MNIEHISVSRHSIFVECNQRYKYRYHLKVPTTEPEPIYFAYGSIVHKIAETYVEHQGKTPIGEICQDVLRGKISLDDGKPLPELPLEYKNKLPQHLRAIQTLNDRIGFDGYLEREFKYDLDPPNKKYVLGYIDRLIIRGDKCIIIDYKTTKKGKWRKTSENIAGDLQLRCYGRVAQKEYGIKPENISAGLYYLEGPELVGCKFSEKSLENAEKELLYVYNQIKMSNPDNVQGKVGEHCNRCDYNKICPFFRSSSVKSNWDGDLTILN